MAYRGLLTVIDNAFIEAPMDFITKNPNFQGIFHQTKLAASRAGWVRYKVATCKDLKVRVDQYAESKTEAALGSGGGGGGRSQLWWFVLTSIGVISVEANTLIAWGLTILTFLFGAWLMLQSKNTKIATP